MSKNGSPVSGGDRSDVWAVIFRAFSWPFRVLKGLSKAALVLFLTSALLLNFATVSSATVFRIVSSIASMVPGVTTIRSRQLVDVEELKLRNSILSGEKDRLDATVKEQDKRLRELRTKSLRQKETIQALKSERTVIYRGSKRPVREAVADTSKRVANRTLFAAKRNVASTFGEALPFVGIAVIVGATAWELKDTCDLMKDMYELDVAFNPGNAIKDNEVCGIQVPTASEILSEVKNSPAEIWERLSGFYGDEVPNDPSLAKVEIDQSWASTWYNWIFGNE